MATRGSQRQSNGLCLARADPVVLDFRCHSTIADVDIVTPGGEICAAASA